MRQNSVVSEPAQHSGPRWMVGILLLGLCASICGCASDAFLLPPDNLPYAQEHEQDSRSSDSSSIPPLHETF